MRFINLFLIIFLIGSANIFAQTAEFTYQGRLTDNSSPANGTYQMRFSLFDAQFGGAQIGSTIENTSVQVVNGVFTVGLDFGTTPFANGDDRFLEIEVRRNSGETYTALAPRQQVTSTPYSIRSISSGVANTANNSIQLGGVDSSDFVQTNDPRLSDDRTPTAGSGFYIQNTTTQQTANFNVSGTGTANTFRAATQYNVGGSRVLSIPGGDNTFVGRDAGTNNIVAIVTGRFNSFFGHNAGRDNTSGYQNSFFGSNAGVLNAGGIGNSFVGISAGSANTTGLLNTFLGAYAGDTNTTGDANTIIGADADVSSGNLNSATAIGSGAIVSTSNTIQLGRSSDRTNVSGIFNVLNGRTSPIENGDVNFTTSSGNFNLYMQGGSNGGGINLGVQTPGSGNATFFISHFDGNVYQDRLVIKPGGTVEVRVLGFAGSTALCRNDGNEIATCSSSIRYKSNVENFSNGLEIIKKLRPVSFNWKESGMLDFGLVAEEVAEVEPLLTTQNADGKTEGVKYDRVGVVLVNAVKEQQKQIKAQQTEIEKQQEKIKKQEETNQSLERKVETQQKQIDELKQVVCSIKPEAEVCQKEEN